MLRHTQSFQHSHPHLLTWLNGWLQLCPHAAWDTSLITGSQGLTATETHRLAITAYSPACSPFCTPHDNYYLASWTDPTVCEPLRMGAGSHPVHCKWKQSRKCLVFLGAWGKRRNEGVRCLPMAPGKEWKSCFCQLALPGEDGDGGATAHGMPWRPVWFRSSCSLKRDFSFWRTHWTWAIMATWIYLGFSSPPWQTGLCEMSTWVFWWNCNSRWAVWWCNHFPLQF